jgi:hypothetical protein
MGTPHSGGSLTWQQILAHYYPTYTLTQGASATIDSARPIPAVVEQGGSFTINYSITTSEGMSVILDAGIAPMGTGVLSLDRAHDAKVGLFEGQNTASRTFSVTQLQNSGIHDLYVALWHDKNNNNVIDGGDFIINAQLIPGALTVTSATGVNESSPCAFALFQNYPNPFNPTTTIRFSVGTYGHTSLRIFDLLGREVATLVNEELQPGEYNKTFDASRLSGGVYTCRLAVQRKGLKSGTGSFVQSIKLLLLK